MPQPSPYSRPLSPFERMWLAAQETCGCVVVEGDGRLSVPALRAAVERAAVANPGSRLQLRGFGRWARWEAVDVMPTVIEVDGAGWDGCGMEGIPFSDVAHMDPKQAPSVSYIIVRGERPLLIQRSHHATMDGRGCLLFLTDVFRALRGEPIVGAPSVDTDIALAKALGGRKRTVTNVCLNPFADPGTGISGSTWRRLRVTGRILPKPLPRTILAISGLARRQQDGPVLIDIPVDLRASFPAVHSTGNLTGSLRLEIPPDATADSIAAEIRAQLAANRQADALVSAPDLSFYPLQLLRPVARSMARKTVQNSTFTPTAAVSNLGRQNMADFSDADFKASSCFIVPPRYDGVPLFLAIFGNEQGLDLCARAPVALGSDGRLDALLQDIARSLVETPAPETATRPDGAPLSAA